MPTTWNAIYLGKLSLMDTSGGDSDMESASKLENTTYGSETNPLYKQFVTISPDSQKTYDLGGNTGAYNNNADGQALNGQSNIEYFRDGDDVRHAYDGMEEYNATITYTDGTTADVTAILFQDWNGLTYWGPEVNANADQTTMEVKPIQSLAVHGLTNNISTDLTASRQLWDYAVPCFTAGTMIETAQGARQIETLRVGELVLTADNGLQPIRWIGSRKFGRDQLEAAPALRPIRIKAGALGRNTPTNDLVVSPQHRVLIRSKIAQRMFGTDEVLVAAKQLLEMDGIEVVRDVTEVEYIHFMFDRHEVVISNGARTESLFTGPEALKAVGPASREEIFTIFPELRREDAQSLPARVLANGRTGRRLAARHARNTLELVS